MPTLEKSDLTLVALMNREIAPLLTELVALVRTHPIDDETYKKLNLVAQEISGKSPDYRTAFVGLIDITKEKIGTLVEFKDFKKPIELHVQTMAKVAILEKGFPFVLPKLNKYIESLSQILKSDSSEKQLCEKVTASLSKLETAVEDLRKKFASPTEEKTPAPKLQ